MTGLIIFMAVAVVAVAFVWWQTKKKQESVEALVNHQQQPAEGEKPAGNASGIQFVFHAGEWYMCLRNYMTFVKGDVYQSQYQGKITDADGKSYALECPALYFRPATEDEIPQPEPTPEPEPDPEPTPEPDTERFEIFLQDFAKVVTVERGSLTYDYLFKLYAEAEAQYRRGVSVNGLPMLMDRNNFPVVYDYWVDGGGNEDATFASMVGWLIALQLAELCPQKRNDIFSIGYVSGGFATSFVYGYEFMNDPNVARCVASVIYAAMRGLLKPDINAMRREVSGSKYDRTLYQLWDEEPRNHVADDAFYIDFRQFMVSAPGPYAPGYTNRPRATFPDQKVDNGCLKVDMLIHQYITGAENLPNQSTVQAIADKDWDTHHFFGSDKRGVHGFNFDAVFGEASIGMVIDPEGKRADFLNLVKQIGGSARGILQHADPTLGIPEYGRLRPGCSWEREAQKHSATDDRLNVLADWYIEDCDGNPTGYYDQAGNWVQPDKVKSPQDYEEMQKNELYANSYPSGHSSGSWCAGMSLIEMYPQKADVILREMILFSTNRSITRYHWMSDVIQGRIVGSAMNAVCHAASDYDELMAKITDTD